MTGPPKHRPGRRPPRWTYHYSGHDLLAVIEQLPDGWRVTNARGDELGFFPTRELALHFVETLPEPENAP
jgi:hypothetical protein